MSDTRTPAQIKADNAAAADRATNRNPDGSPYSADRGVSTADPFTGDNRDMVEIPDRGVTGDTTTSVPKDGETVVNHPDGTSTITHTDGKITVFDAKGNAVRSNVPGKQVEIDTAREDATPTNPRFPGEGNPDFKG